MTESHARNTLGVCLVIGGREDEGLVQLVRAGELGRGSRGTMLRFYINYSDALCLAGRYAEAVEQALAGVEVAAGLGLERSTGAMLAGNAAEPLLALGEWDRASQLVERSLELDPPAHHLAHLRLLQCWLRLQTGRLDEAEAILTEFRGLITGPQVAPQYSSQVIRLDVELALATGDVDRAWADLEVAFEHWDLYHVAHRYPLLWLAATTARAADRIDDRGRLARVRSAYEQVEPVRARQIWGPLIEAELVDTLDAWRSVWAASTATEMPCYLRPYAGLRLGSAPRVAARAGRGSRGLGDGDADCRPDRSVARGVAAGSTRHARRTHHHGDRRRCPGSPRHVDHPRARGAAAGGRRPDQRRDRDASCSSAPRPPACTCPTSSPSSASEPAVRPPPSRTGRGCCWSRTPTAP